MTGAFRSALAFSIAIGALSAVRAQEPTDLPATPVAVEAQTPAGLPPAQPLAEAAPIEAATAINEDEMADLLNSRQQIKQDVTLTKTIDGKVIETKTETIIYSKDDPLRDTEAGVSPIERLKAEFDSQSLTRKEALEEARLDFVVADLDRDEAMNASEFVFLVKGWQDAKISGAGHGRFVDPYFHVDQEAADVEHAEQARAKFIEMAGESGTLSKRAFTRKVIAEFEEHDIDKDELLRGDELLNFRASVRGEDVAI